MDKTLFAVMGALILSMGSQNAFAQGHSRLERHWGESLESAKYNQLLDREAQKNRAPVFGLDGQASEKNIENYRESFAHETPQPIYDLNLGLGQSGENQAQ